MAADPGQAAPTTSDGPRPFEAAAGGPAGGDDLPLRFGTCPRTSTQEVAVTSERRTPRTRRGAEAVEAALEELEIRQRVDEMDPSADAPGDYDLTWARERVDDIARAAATDLTTPGEAMEDVARAVGRELPADETIDEEYEP